MEQTGREMMTIKDVMKTLKVSRPTAYRLIVKWNISIFREGQLIRVYRHEFENAVRQQLHKY